MPFTPVHAFELLHLWGVRGVIAAAVVIAASIFLLRLRRGWPARLLVIGAIGLFIVMVARFAFEFSFTHGWLQRTPLLEGCQVIPALVWPVELAELISYAVWIGLAWFCWRITRTRPNQAMERTAGRSAF